MNILEQINSPQDVKTLSIDNMNKLAEDIRECIINRVNNIGGHLGPDLGIVEATIAMHYVFNSPRDKFVFDVSHQCYPHKMLTGRKHGFIGDFDSTISGYSNPQESEHDHFVIGHTSTSVSLATGLAKARDLRNEQFNVIALIGDGSLSGGEALEGLNNAAVLNSNFIIIVNDNEMSIAENQGGLYKNLEILRKTNGKAENNFFKTLGFEYCYLDEGNNIEKLIETFKKVKDTNKPTVVHIHTLKGKGYAPAEQMKEYFHWSLPNTLNGELPTKPENLPETYDSITNEYFINQLNKQEPICVINPATPGVHGFNPTYRKQLGKNFVDVAIAEQHALGFASGLAKGGTKPVLAIHSSFLQRGYDQLSQDLALNNSSATILVYWSGIGSADMTHLGCFDIPLISNIPNIVYLAPTCKEEHLKMLDWAINQNKYTVAIKMLFGETETFGNEDNTDYSYLNKYKVVEQGEKVAIIALGSFFKKGMEVKQGLLANGINATLINPKFITGIDKNLLEKLKENHDLVITLEDGVLDGGFGEKIARFYGNSDVKVLNFGQNKEFTDRVSLDELYEKYHLTNDLIIKDVLTTLGVKYE